MKLTLGKNLSSSAAERQLGVVSAKISSSFQKLSSGLRINSASDDAAGLAVSSGLNVKSRLQAQAVRNLNDGVSALTIVDGALQSLTDIVARQQELAEQSANGTFSSSQRTALDNEFQALRLEYTRIVQTTSFNGTKLLDGTQQNISLQSGTKGSENLSVAILNTVTSSGGGTVGLGTYTKTSTISLGGNEGIITYGLLDINSDGRKDLVTVSTNGIFDVDFPLNLNSYLGTALGSFTQAGSVEVNYNGGPLTQYSVQIGAADPNADGRKEVRVQWSLVDDYGSNSGDSAYTLNTNGSIQSYGGALGGIPLGGGLSSTGDINGDGFSDYVSDDGAGNLEVFIQNTGTGSTSSVESLLQGSTDVTSRTNALLALTEVSSNLDTLSQKRGQIGASLSRINSAIANTRTQALETQNAASRITDVDVASAAANLVKEQIQQSVTTSILAQANQQPEILLKLLRG